MATLDYRIIEFDPHTISEELLHKYFELDNQFCFEIDPDDDPYTHELQKKMIQTINPESEIFRWLVITTKKEHVIGFARVTYVTPIAKNYDKAKNFADMEILVAKDHRGKGLGTKLFRKILEKIKEHGGITTVSVSQVYDISHKFCEKFKGKVVQEEAEYRAYLLEIDWELLTEWQKAGESIGQKDGITLERFEHCPEHLIEDYANIYTETINQRPLGEIEIRHRISPESRKKHEKLWIAERGHKWHTIVTKESDGNISGLTEMVFIPETPYFIEQLLTGVRDQYRGRGLGKWLKAEMALFIKNLYPEVKFILTDNADVNAPMLSINERMNFKRTHTLKTYHFDFKILTGLLKE